MHSLFCLPALVSLLLILFPLFLPAAPQKAPAPAVDPSVVQGTTVKVLRGGTCEVPLRAISPQGYDVKFEILSEPLVGSLSGPQRNSKSSVSYFYTHSGKKGPQQDSFRFKCKSGPQKAWGYAKATILIEELPPRLSVDVEALDFGPVFLGESRTLPIRIKNAGGGQLHGHLKISAPWTFSEPTEFVLAESESKKILITFAPLSSDSQRGSLVFETGTKPFPEILLEGSGKNRFTAPETAAFEPRIGANTLSIPVKNHTAEPLSISIHCPPPLEAPASLELAPESSRDLILTLPPNPFAEKSTLVTLSDGSATQDIRIQLPPPPSRLEWKIEGKNELGRVSPGRLLPLSAQLVNTGNSPARATLHAEGEGFSLVPGQPLECDIPSGGTLEFQAQWKFPESIGPFQATLTAESEGLPPVRATWEADVQPPDEPTPAPASRSTPVPSPTPSKTKILTSEEARALRKRMPGDISYRLEPELTGLAFLPTRRTAAVLVSWTYSGSKPVEFKIQREVQERKGFFDQRVNLPENLPEKSCESVWITVPPATVRIEKLDDGRWQARVPSLRSGYHKIRILAQQPSSPQADGVDFTLLVGEIPPPQPLPWIPPSLLVLFSIYLLRKKILALFG